MFSAVNHFEACKAVRVNLTVELNTDYCQIVKIIHLNQDYYNLI